MPFHWPSAHNRLFEWMMAMAMLSCAFGLMAPAETLDRSVLRLAGEAGLTEGRIAFLFFVFGLLRIGALIANGSSKVYGPWCRVAASAVSALVLGIMTFILVLDASVTGAPAFAIPWIGMPVFGEMVVIYRAAFDGSPRRP